VVLAGVAVVYCIGDVNIDGQPPEGGLHDCNHSCEAFMCHVELKECDSDVGTVDEHLDVKHDDAIMCQQCFIVPGKRGQDRVSKACFVFWPASLPMLPSLPQLPAGPP
jgi:hypothetical protein